jgi:hypothetical protein
MNRAAIIALLLSATPAWSQAWTPPYCTGPNAALQYNEKGWLCVTISATPMPAQPPPTQCITSHWNGTAWVCVPTEYLTTGGQTPQRR